LAGLAGVSAIGLPLLAACGGNNSTATDSTRSDSANGAGATTSAPDPAGSSSPASSGGGSSDGLTTTSDIPVGGGKIFSDQKVVVTQPVAGEFKGFSSTCTHEGCQVTKIVGQSIECPCHGSMYSIIDGSVQGGPAPKPLPAVKLSVAGDEISLA
jgi:Rieske Fe-S protein